MAIASGERRDRLRDAYVRAFDASLGLQHREPRAVAAGLLLRVQRGLLILELADDLGDFGLVVGAAEYIHGWFTSQNPRF